MKNILILCCTFLLSTITSAQSTWYEIPTGTSNKLNSIDFPSNNVGYIVGVDTTILKTTDGGQTWIALGLNGISISSGDDDFTDVHFLDENIGFLVSGYSGVWKTVDGAQSWTQAGSGMCFPYTVFPMSGTDYVVGGEGCFGGTFIDYFENGGVSGDGILVDSTWKNWGRIQDMSFVNSTDGLAAASGDYILKTIDAGHNWDTIWTGAPGAHTSVIMVDDTLCYAGYQDPNSQGFGILISEDGGLTWNQDVNSATFYYPDYLSVHAADNGDVYSGAVPSNSPGGLIFESTDGISWNYYNVDQAINAMTSYGSDITFGVGDSGYLVVNRPVAELSVTQSEFLDFEVYPNPVSDELMIRNLKNQQMDIRIVDVSGAVVQTNMNQNGSSTIDVAELEDGVYFVEVRIGQDTGVKRIVKK